MIDSVLKKPDKNILVGRINGLFGIKGLVKIFSYTHPRKNISNYQPWLVKPNREWRALTVIQCTEQAKTIVAKIKNIDNINAAKQLLDADIYIKRSQLPQLNKCQYYWNELIGLKVINKKGVDMGEITSLIDTGANHVLVVNGNKERLIPFIKPFLIAVDKDKRRVLVDWSEFF